MAKHIEMELDEFIKLKAKKDIRRIDDFGIVKNKPSYRKLTVLYMNSDKKINFLYLYVKDDGSAATEQEIFRGYSNARAKHSYFKFIREVTNESNYYEEFQTRTKR